MAQYRTLAHRASAQSRLGRLPQRFLTGLVLGMILAIAIGTLMPLMAQTPPPVAPSTPTETESPQEVPPGSPAPVPQPAPPVIPTDIADHWASSCLRSLALDRVLPLDAAAQFSPDEPATWDAIAPMMVRAFPATAMAYAGASPLERALGITTPVNPLFSYPGTYFTPDRPLARAEVLTALAAKRSLPYVARATDLLKATFADGAQVPLYGREGVAAALQAGAIVRSPQERGSARLSPNQVITRGEVAALLCQTHEDEAVRRTISPDWVTQPTPPAAQLIPGSELRGVWLTNIDSTVLFSKANLREGIDRLKSLNFNTVYPVVWNGGYTLYPSAVGERLLGEKKRLFPGNNPSFEAQQGDRNMLQEVIDLAHAENMAVIPWFEFGFMAPADYALRQQRPEWFTQRLDGSQEIQQGAETFTWMNPFHPQVQQLLLLMIDEVLQTYPVEGIQMDDHLGMPVDMGYDPYTVQLYRLEHGGAAPPENPDDGEWVRWRAQKITEFMGKVRTLVDQRRPGAIVSVSPNPYPFSYVRYLQDWPEWERLGYVDELVIQVYRDDVDRFVWELNKPTTEVARRRVPTAIGLLSGLRGRPTDAALLAEQLEATRDRAYAGVSYFFYETLWVPGQESREDRLRQFLNHFALNALRPKRSR